MTTASPSRRERLRLATTTEIREAARRLLIAGGPPAISLRAIARDMGLTAAALYRYYPSLDALVIDLGTSLYEELSGAIHAARDRVPADRPIGRLREMAREFRRWGLTHPAEFSLIFGSPVPGVTQFEAFGAALQEAGIRCGAAFLLVIGDLWQVKPFNTPPPAVIDEQLGAHLAPYIAHHGADLPLPVVYTFLAGWTRLYGMVAMEVFGHLSWALTDSEPLFEMELEATIGQLGVTD